MLIAQHQSETLQTPSKAPKAAVHQVSTLLKLNLSIYPVSGTHDTSIAIVTHVYLPFLSLCHLPPVT